MTLLDWAICGVYLVLVLVLGAWCSRGQHSNDDYLVGDRRMNWLAIGVSLFATTFSSLSFVGLPREAAYEDYHLYLAILFIPLVAAPIVGWLFVPLYHRLRLISAYEYLERRFDRRLRLLGSLLACLYMLGWMGSMLYATGLILQAVLGLSDSGLTWTLVGLGLFTTLYTSVGGFKAVVWTDVFQAVVLFGGMLIVLILALDQIPGGWPTVWRLGTQHGKFQMFDLRFDLTDRANFFSAAAYGVFVYLDAHATGQAAVQRYVSMPTVTAARWSLVVNGVLTAGVCLVFFLVGSTLFGYYHHALPPDAEPGSGFPVLARQDQLTPHFIQTVLAVPGLMGLLLSGLFAAVMSSIDSGANSMTSLVVCDWLDSRKLALRESRLLCGLFGVGAIVMSLLVPHLGTHVFDIIVTIAGALFGPLLGVFALGIFVRRANAPGAALGLLAGAISLALVFPTSISPWWYGAFTCVPTFVVGLLASFLFPAPQANRVHGLVIRQTLADAATIP
jgi:SSS family transporter